MRIACTLPAPLRSGVLGLFLASCLSPGASRAEGEAWIPPGPSCETDHGWSSRYQARTPEEREDCVHALASLHHRIRTSHLRRGLPEGEHREERFGMAPQPLSVAPVDEQHSKLEVSGGLGLWSYEADFDLGREARLDGARLLPEGRSQIQLQSGLDFGLVRSRVELKSTQREEERPFVQGFDDGARNTSELGARAFVDLTLPHLPVLTLGAGRAQKDVFRGGRDSGEKVDSDLTSAALWHAGSRWQAYAVASRYVFRDDRTPGAPEGIYDDHYVSFSWWPAAGWTLNPSLQYSEASYDGRQSWTRTLRGSLGVYGTGLWENGTLTLWTGYTRDRDTAETFDYEQLDLSVGVEHTLGQLAFLGGYELSLGGTLGYSHYLDRLAPEASGPGYRTTFTLRIVGL